MIQQAYSKEKRTLRQSHLEADLVVVGGGMSGVCCSITAARAGIKVILVQDRPVLGGNASSEVRLWILGATSHMGNNNRWSREGGVIDEILVENVYRNKEGNPLMLDTILLEKVREEENITLLLNTAVYDVRKKEDRIVESVKAFCSQTSTEYLLQAPLFCDASGDGIVAFQAGASFRMGAEKAEEFGEGFAPDVEDYGELLGHSIYFYTKNTGRPVQFVAPSFAIKNAGALPRIRNYRLQEDGCRLWWVEYGGRLDTIHQSEDIKWELWRVVYGIWDYVKNSGNFPEADHLTLEWVGTIPGKRESRRFEGDYMLIQQDIVEQRQHKDAVAFGGWAMDLHPADGVYSEKNGCTQWHSKGIYQIPYRCYYSKDINNLFLAGRIISTSHVAFGSSRVMATCSHGAQAVGMAAALVIKHTILPRTLSQSPYLEVLQQALNKIGQSIPHIPINNKENIVAKASRIEADSELILNQLPTNGNWKKLNFSAAQMLPLEQGEIYTFKINVKADAATRLEVQLRVSEKAYNYSPEEILETKIYHLQTGEQEITLNFSVPLTQEQYAFICFMKNEQVAVQTSNKRVTGLMTVYNKINKAVSNFGKQEPPADIGIDSFEFWTPERRPKDVNLALTIEPPLAFFSPKNITNGWVRPTTRPNAFIGALDAREVTLDVYWNEPQEVKEIKLFFDTDYDDAMESSLKGHEQSIVPFVVRNYEVKNCGTTTIYIGKENHQTINTIQLSSPITTVHLQIILQRPSEDIPASLFEVLCY